MTPFTKGQRVTMTEAAYKNAVRVRDKKPATGVVAHEPRTSHLVSVRIDGQKTPAIYHVDFWRPSTAEEMEP